MDVGEILLKGVKGKKYSYDIILSSINPVEVQILYKTDKIYTIGYSNAEFINKIFENRMSEEDAAKLTDVEWENNKDLDIIYKDFIEITKKIFKSEIEYGLFDNLVDEVLHCKK